MNKPGLILVISAPSGAGKTTICRQLLRQNSNLVFSVSLTTRTPRPGEKNGRDYFFTTKKDFRNQIRNKQLVEWARLFGNYYGTPRKFLEKTIRPGQDILLEIDIVGAKKIKKAYPESILIFILPPSLAELKKRLVNRGKIDPRSLTTRLSRARQEIKNRVYFDYIVVNDLVKKAVQEIAGIIKLEKLQS